MGQQIVLYKDRAYSTTIIQKDAKIPYDMSFHHFALGMVHLVSGNIKQSEESFQDALRMSGKHNEKWIEGTARIYLGITIAQDDNSKLETAEKSILEGIGILEDRKIRPWASIGYFNLGMVQTHLGDVKQARINLEKAAGMFKEMGMNYWFSLIRQTRGG